MTYIRLARNDPYPRKGFDWIKRFSVIAGAFDVSDQLIIDGQVVHQGRYQLLRTPGPVFGASW